jgi:cation diffusion facilitator family transporter
VLIRGAWISLTVGALVFALKFAAYRVTGSVALLSDALESVVNVVAAAVALWALWLAGKPADREHPFGHGKAEYFSAALEGGLILFAALQIVQTAVQRLQSQVALENFGLGAALSIGATALNLGLSLYLIRLAKSQRSPALEADGQHILSDVYSSVGVLLGVSLGQLLGLKWLDPVVALLVALYIVWVGYRLIRRSLGALMDESVPAADLEHIRGVLKANLGAALEIHDLKARQAGQGTFIEFHLVVPGRMTVLEAHHLSDALEDVLEKEIPGSTTMIHLEPEDKALHGDLVQRF